MGARAVIAVLMVQCAVLASPAAGAECQNEAPLGVSRVAEIDTTGGALYGGLQYISNSDFLNDKEVVLTFDDGPHVEHTPSILATLAMECTRATFFVVGRMALAHPDTLKAIVQDGHSVGVHTWSHAWIGKLTPERAKAEFEMAVSALPLILGRPIAPFFRFPFLSDPKTEIDYIKSRNFGIFSIDIDSYDSRGLSAERIVRHTMKLLRNRGRGIILFHDIKRTTAAALPQILRELKQDGFRVVHMVAAQAASPVAEYDAEVSSVFSKRFPAKLGKDGKPDTPGAYPRPVLLAQGAPVAPIGRPGTAAPGAVQVASVADSIAPPPMAGAAPAPTTPSTAVTRVPARGPRPVAAQPAPLPDTAAEPAPIVVAALAPTAPVTTAPKVNRPEPQVAATPGPDLQRSIPAQADAAVPVSAPAVTAAVPPTAPATADQTMVVASAAVSDPAIPAATELGEVVTPPVPVALVPNVVSAADSVPTPETASPKPTAARSFLAMTVPRNKRTPQVGLLRLSAAGSAQDQKTAARAPPANTAARKLAPQEHKRAEIGGPTILARASPAPRTGTRPSVRTSARQSRFKLVNLPEKLSAAHSSELSRT